MTLSYLGLVAVNERKLRNKLSAGITKMIINKKIMNRRTDDRNNL